MIKKNLKRIAALLLALILIYPGVMTASAAKAESQPKAIGIVFDNSGSMYERKKQDWCRAIYAMEVFASMLNEKDTLLIYPMNLITIDGKEYTMNSPYKLTGPEKANSIRNILSPHKTREDRLTPIESVDCAAEGLKKESAKDKYLIILSDGDVFHKDGKSLENKTRDELDARVEKYASKDMTVMFLGVNENSTMPSVEESDYFVKRRAGDSDEVLNILTEMCNRIFGRDTMSGKTKPDSGAPYFSGNNFTLDISASKLIVFIQGENVSNLKITNKNGSVGNLVSSSSTKYSNTPGSTPFPDAGVDTNLQGMMVTYTDCPTGEYTISYSGKASNVEVYYEPNADLNFVFTDIDGNEVDPATLYEGDYKVSFGMKDAATGKLVSSGLLGKPKYKGQYFINGNDQNITDKDSKNGYSGEVTVSLKKGDKFDANLTVTYLSDYSIHKTSKDFGWPDGGIEVVPRPAGDLVLEITGGSDSYELQTLEEGEAYIAKVFYQGTQLTGDVLEKEVELKWDSDTSNAEVTKEFMGDHYLLRLSHKNPSDPQATACGECTVTIYTYYTPPGSNETRGQAPLSYEIIDSFSPLQMELFAPSDYIVISKLGDSQPMEAMLTMTGKPLTAEEFSRVKLSVYSPSIDYEITEDPDNSKFYIQLLPTDGVDKGDYPIKVTATYTDLIGRETKVSDEVNITLSNMPLWLKWLIFFGIALLLFLIIWFILHIKVLPTKLHKADSGNALIYNGENKTQLANFDAALQSGTVELKCQYGAKTFGVAMDVVPGKESYLYKGHGRRSAEVKPDTVRVSGQGKVSSILIGSVKYVTDDRGQLKPKVAKQGPFPLTNGMTVKFSGNVRNAGVENDFDIRIKMDFKKKK